GMWRTSVPPESRIGGKRTATGTVSPGWQGWHGLTNPPPTYRSHVLRDPPPTPLTSAPTRRSFTVLKEPARLPPPDNGLNSVMGRGGTVAAIRRRHIDLTFPVESLNGRRCSSPIVQ